MNLKPLTAMQVSWIDPQDVASLAESLRTPASVPLAEEPSLSLLEPDEMAALRGTFDAWNDAAEETPSPAALPPVAEEQEEPAMTAEDASNPILQRGPDLDAFRQRLQAIRDRAVDAGLLPPPQAPQEESAAPISMPETIPQPPPAAPFTVPTGSVMERLEAFDGWARHRCGEGEIFVMDDQGDLLCGRQEQAGLILSTLLALNAAARSSAWSACGGPQVLHHSLPSGDIITVIPCPTRLGVMQVAVTASQAIPEDSAALLRSALIAAMDAEA